MAGRSEGPSAVERQFTQQTNAIDVDKHMVAYVEEQMRLRRGVSKSPEPAPINPMDELYKLSAGITAISKPKVEEPVEGAPALSAAMLVEIPEVDLGVAYAPLSRAHAHACTDMARGCPQDQAQKHRGDRDCAERVFATRHTAEVRVLLTCRLVCSPRNDLTSTVPDLHSVDMLPGNLASTFDRRRGKRESDEATDEQLMERFKRRFAARQQQRR